MLREINVLCDLNEKTYSGSLYEKWSALESGWQASLVYAWESLKNNSLPIGCVIQNEKDETVSMGKNMICCKEGNGMPLYGNKLAHAEINAILQIADEEKHPNIRKYTLFTTLEPCPFCFGAMVIGNIRRIKYAARDKWGGAAVLNTNIESIKSKNIFITGPVRKLEIIQIALLTYYDLKNHPINYMDHITSWKEDCIKGVNIGRELFESEKIGFFIENNFTMEQVYDYILERYRIDREH
jgi:tRNA(adenine34) deaminase